MGVLMYRPKDWENPHLYFGSPHTEFDEISNGVYKAYEAGADAMLEGLRKYGEAMGASMDEVPYELRVGGRKGYLVFIPEEQSG